MSEQRYLTKEERLKLQSIKEDYLFILTDHVDLRDSNPSFFHMVVDQWEAVKLKLEEDEDRRIMDKCTVIGQQLDDAMSRIKEETTNG